MKILLVTPRFPYPTRTGDTLTVFHLLKYFSQRHTVDLVSCSTHALPEEHRAAIAPYCRNLHSVRISSVRSFFNGTLAVLSRQPLQAAWFHSPKVAATIDGLVEQQDYDVLYAHTVRAARYLIDKQSTPALRVLAMQISMQLNYQRLARYERNPLYRLAFRHEAARLGSFERELVERFDRTLVISDIDRAAINDQPSDRFFECPHGVRLDDEPASVNEREANTIVFSGNMNYRPNVDAAIFFYREIFPRVRSRFPEAVFFIVGANPDASIRALTQDSGVRVTGEVESIYPWLRRAAVGIDPLRAGAGLQNKVLEGMACGLPMVVTPVANEGIRATPEVHLLASEDAAAFADQVIRLFEDVELRRRLGDSGRRFIEENWSWDTHFKRLEQMFAEEVESRSAATDGKESGCSAS